MMEMGRGGACVPARVAPQGRIHRSFPAHNACIFWYGNAAARTFGRACRHRPYGSFGQITRGTVGGFEQIARG